MRLYLIKDKTSMKRALQEAHQDLSEEGLDETVFARCRRVMCAEYVKDFDSTEEIANSLLGYVFDEGEMFAYGDLLKDVTLADAEQLLHEAFSPEYVCMAVVKPMK